MRAVPWITAVVIVVLDQITKALVRAHLVQGALVPVVPGLSLSHVHNRGIAFSLFADGGLVSRVVLHMVIVGAVIVISWMLVRHGQGRLAAFGFGLVLGGAVGNLIDRVMHGYVIDFVHVWVRIGERTASWPDFNVADSSITVGAVLLVVREIWGTRSASHQAADREQHASQAD
jgi:signal peptidase II